MPVPPKDPYCDCGNLIYEADVVGNTGHMMNCPRYREMVYGEKPDPDKIITELRERIHKLEFWKVVYKGWIKRLRNEIQHAAKYLKSSIPAGAEDSDPEPQMLDCFEKVLEHTSKGE